MAQHHRPQDDRRRAPALDLTLLHIRPEEPGDRGAVWLLNRAAFVGSPGEADLVEALRDDGKVVLSLVAEIEGRVVGHVLFTHVSLGGPYSTSTALGLGPLAVLPGYQGQGVGSALVRKGLDACREAGYTSVFLLGAPAYYSRFGFVQARRHGVHFQDDRDAFQVVELVPGSLSGSNATLSYEPQFDAVSSHPPALPRT